MATTVIADSPPAPASAPGQPGTPTGAPPAPPTGSAAMPEASARSCANCGSAMAPGQDWCLQCGAGAPGGGGSSGWRSAATLLVVTVVLALGAAAAAFAALSKETHKPGTVTMTVAQAVAPVVPTTTTPTTPLPSTPSVKTNIPTTALKPPKIPLIVTPTPIPTKTSTAGTPTPGGETAAPTKTTPSSTPNPETASEGSQPSALLLDTNAASTYNPYTYPESEFGDPSLTIDGDPTTGWTAVVQPTTAPKMADGVLIDLKTPHKLSSLVLITTTPGVTVQVYGANGTAAPTSITDPAWIPLSHSRTIAKKHVRIKLRDQKKAFTFVTLWVSKAPASLVGTPTAPGRVSINEIELFPAH